MRTGIQGVIPAECGEIGGEGSSPAGRENVMDHASWTATTGCQLLTPGR